MSAFIEEVTRLLDAHWGPARYKVITAKDYPKQASAYVELSIDGMNLRVINDRNRDFSVEVASPSAPSKFHGLRVLLVLVLGLPVERSSVMVGHDIGAIERELEELVAHQGAIVDALSPAKWPETEARLADIGKQLMHPILRDALERSKA